MAQQEPLQETQTCEHSCENSWHAPGLHRGLREAMFTPSSTWDLLLPLMVHRPLQEPETKSPRGYLERGIKSTPFIALVSTIILFS